MARTDHLIDDATLSVQELARIYRTLSEPRRWAFACSLSDHCFELLFRYLSTNGGQPPTHSPIQEVSATEHAVANARKVTSATGGAGYETTPGLPSAGMGD